jgi:hypothetical protein
MSAYQDFFMSAGNLQAAALMRLGWLVCARHGFRVLPRGRIVR